MDLRSFSVSFLEVTHPNWADQKNHQVFFSVLTCLFWKSWYLMMASASCSWMTGVEPDVMFCFKMGCASWDAFLLTTAVKSDYSSYCILPVSSDQSGSSVISLRCFRLQRSDFPFWCSMWALPEALDLHECMLVLLSLHRLVSCLHKCLGILNKMSIFAYATISRLNFSVNESVK